MSKKTHEGWFAIKEEWLRTIERTFDDPSVCRKANAALMTVCRIVNLEGSQTFQRTISEIAKDMSYSYPHAAEALRLLETVGFLKIKENKIEGTHLKAKSEYTFTQNVPSIKQADISIEQDRNSPDGPIFPNNNQQPTNNSSKNTARFDAKGITLPFASSEFSNAWGEWVQHCSERRCKITRLSASKQLDQLRLMGEQRAIAAISNSILKGYRAIFESNSTNKPAPKNNNQELKYDY